MLIGFDASRAVRPHPTGTEVYAAELLRALAPLDDRNDYRLYVNGRSTPRFAPVPSGAQWRPLWLPRAWTKIRLSWEMRRHAPDLLVIPSYILPPVAPPRSVVTVHGLEHLAVPDAYSAAERSALDAFLADTIRRATAIVVPSETTCADLVVRLGVHRRRITVIPHGVRAGFTPRPDAEVDAVVRRYGLERGGYLVFLGSAAARKDPLTAARALVRARHQGAGSELRLALAGMGREAAAPLLAEVEHLGAAGAVAPLGYVPDTALPALLCGALAFVFPSRYEGFGIPAIEAMACGVPCILSEGGALPEVSQVAALLAPPGDVDAWAEAICSVAGNAELRATLSRRGRHRSAQFRWDSSARAHLEVYERVGSLSVHG